MSARSASVLLLATVAAAAHADNTNTWGSVGEIGGPAFWAAGLASSFFQDGAQGKAHAARMLDGLLVDGALTEGLKQLSRERRPYSGGHDSFPSLHASLSFEVAAAASYYHPGQAPVWYGAAALVAYSRIPAHEHHWQDVIAGAVLGYACGQLSVSSRRGWLIAPAVERGPAGLAITFGRSF